MAVQSEAQAILGVALTWRQLGALAGIIGVVLFVVGIIMEGDTPTLNDSISDVRAWYADNGQQFLVADYIIGLGVILGLVPFFLVLRSFIGEAEGSPAIWSQVAFFGAFLFVVVGGAASSFNGALAIDADQLNDDAVVRALLQADFYAFGGLSLALTLFFLGTAFGIIRTALFWTWLAWLCLALAVVSVIGAASTIEGDPEGVLSWLSFLSFIGLGVVVLSLSVGMLAKRASP